MEDNESCGSRVHDTTSSASSLAQGRQHRQKLEVYNEILRRLKESKNEEAYQPGFDDELWAHFNRLPTRYLILSLFYEFICLCVCVMAIEVFCFMEILNLFGCD